MNKTAAIMGYFVFMLFFSLSIVILINLVYIRKVELSIEKLENKVNTLDDKLDTLIFLEKK